MNAPVFEVEAQLFRFQDALGILTNVMKRFPDGLPLKLYLLKNSLQNILLPNEVLTDTINEGCQLLIIAELTFFEGRVLLRIVSEIKTLHLMNVVADPFRKVLVGNKASLISQVFVLHQLLKILVGELIISAEVPKDIFYRDKTVMITV